MCASEVRFVQRHLPCDLFPVFSYVSQLLNGLVSVMTECWYFDGEARNEILFYKMKLFRLAKEDKIEYDVQEE